MRKIAFWLSLALIFTIPWEAVVEYPILGSISRLTGMLVAGFWLGTVLTTRRIRKPSPFNLWTIIFIVWNATSVFWSGNADRTVEHVGTWSQLFILSYILWDLYTDRSKILTGLQMFVVGAYVVFGNTIINFISGHTFYFERFSATGTNPDDLGAILAIGIPVAWYLCAPKNSAGRSRLWKWVNYIYIPMALMGIALSGTRTAMIAALPGIIFGLASLTRLRFATRMAIIAILLLSAIYLIPMIPEASIARLSTTGSELTGGDLNGRLELWQQGLVSFEKHPILGVGSNMYRSVNTEGKVAHNSFISVLVEVGLVGLSLFLLILITAAIEALRHTGWDRYFWLTVLASWTVAVSTLTWEYRKPTWLILSLIIASASISVQAIERQSSDRTNTAAVQLSPVQGNLRS